MKSLVVVFDLDCTLIENSHRINEFGDASLGYDMEYWLAHSDRENVMKDQLLPLAKLFYEFQKTDCVLVAVTAREMLKADFEFLEHHGLNFHAVLHREDSKELDYILKERKLTELFRENDYLPFLAFDDKPENLAIFKKFGFKCFDALKLNKQLNGKDVPCSHFKMKK